jgi:hypothetical protein
LFSQANLSEFIAMKDIETARRVEVLIAKAYPHLHVIDLTLETDLVRERDPHAPIDPDAPDPHWMLQDLGQRALITEGAFNSHRFISDAITHADTLLAGFDEMKKMIAGGVIEAREKVLAENDRKDLVPHIGMRLKDALRDELLFEPTAPAGQKFHENDATDFVHALPACLLCDMVLLDTKWCHKVNVAERRIRDAEIQGNIAACFSPRDIEAFLSALEARAEPK